MRCIIAGSRHATKEQVEEAMRTCPFAAEIKVVLSGAAPRGADVYGEEWAIAHGKTLKRHPADWQRFGDAAGPIRNNEMSLLADAAVLVWDGTSSGTRSMLKYAQQRRLRIHMHVIPRPT